MKTLCLYTFAFCVLLLTSCTQKKNTDSLTIYCSIDEIWSAPLFEKFTERTGIDVKPVYDSEANKSVGLANRLIAEKQAPVADIYWSGEPLQIQRLAAADVLKPYADAGISLPEYYANWNNAHWFPNSFRQRVFVINTNRVKNAKLYPTSIAALTNSTWSSGKIAMANPQFGSTLFHFASLYAQMGEDAFRQFLRDIKANKVTVYAGNSQVALQTKSGAVAVGLTDNDDATREIEKGAPFVMKETGTYFPSAIGIIAQPSPKKEIIQAFVDFVISDEIQRTLHDKAPYNYMVSDVLGNNLCTDNSTVLVENMPAFMKVLRQEKL